MIGIGFRCGKDSDGKIYIEGSRTGPIFDEGSFSSYAKGKTDDIEIIARAVHYDNILVKIKSASFMKAVPNNTKIVCELFYNSMSEMNEKGIKFVTITYDKTKLGSEMTILPYTILESSSGKEHPEKDEILSNLYKQSNDKIKIIDPNLNFTEIDINTWIDPISTISDDSLLILKSRKAADKENKQNLLNIIQQMKDEMGDYLLNHPGIEGKFKLGSDIERFGSTFTRFKIW